MDLNRKRVNLEDLAAWRAQVRDQGQSLVVTNGCFDILHAGHVTYLAAARRLGDLLLVGLNSDESIRQLKGQERPIHPEEDRALLLGALEMVDAVCIFPEVRAVRFLELAAPTIYVKGGDFTVDELPPEERRVVEAQGGRIRIMPVLPGRSTTSLIDKIRRS